MGGGGLMRIQDKYEKLSVVVLVIILVVSNLLYLGLYGVILSFVGAGITLFNEQLKEYFPKKEVKPCDVKSASTESMKENAIK